MDWDWMDWNRKDWDLTSSQVQLNNRTTAGAAEVAGAAVGLRRQGAWHFMAGLSRIAKHFLPHYAGHCTKHRGWRDTYAMVGASVDSMKFDGTRLRFCIEVGD